MLARPPPHHPNAPLACTSLRRGLSVDIFAATADGDGHAAPPPTVALPAGVSLPTTLARLLSGMSKEAASAAGQGPALSLRIYKSDGSGALTRLLSVGEAEARAAAAAAAAAAVAATLAGGAARGSSGLVDALLAAGVVGGGDGDRGDRGTASPVLVATPRGQRRGVADGAAAAVPPPPRYATRNAGVVGTLSDRVFVVDAATGAAVSPWTDVPLCAADGDDRGARFNFVCEVPRGGRAKFEVDTAEAGHPLRQDINKDGTPRFYPSPMMWNYGMLPRTIEDKEETWPGAAAAGDAALAAALGDGDPVDVVEVGAAPCPPGSVTPVRLLGALAMIDGGELDWKLLALDAASPLAAAVHDVDSLEVMLPGEVGKIVAWFSNYKGPGAVAFGLGGRVLPAAEAEVVVAGAATAFERGRL